MMDSLIRFDMVSQIEDEGNFDSNVPPAKYYLYEFILPNNLVIEDPSTIYDRLGDTDLNVKNVSIEVDDGIGKLIIKTSEFHDPYRIIGLLYSDPSKILPPQKIFSR